MMKFLLKNFPECFILFLFFALLVAGIIEKRLHRRDLDRIPVRILVNGTRGKTSVTRLIAAVLRESGLRTWAKTTGSQASWILPDGSEREYRKNRPVSVREQIPFIRNAVKDGAGAVVVECMALHAENQRVTAQEFIRPGIVVITNARVDHVLEIGATEEETVSTLSLSVPEDAQLVSDEARFDGYTKNRVSSADVKIDREYLDSFGYPMFEDNVRLVLKTAELLGIDRETALAGMKHAAPDPGMAGPFREGKCLIINGFAANDRDSALLLFQDSVKKAGMEDAPLHVLFNNRSDREFRLKQFVPVLQALPCASVSVTGENTEKAARALSRAAGIHAGSEKDALAFIAEKKDSRSVVLCLGNIKGEGMRLIRTLQEKEALKHASAGDRY